MNVTDIKFVRPSSLKKLSNVEDIYPLAPMQQGMLFHSILDPSVPMYMGQMAFRIDSRVNVQSFRRAWEEVVRRHAILRTAFVWENLKEPMQVVRKNVELPWREEDWSSWSEAEQEEKWRTFLEEDRERGFDLKQAPLLRFGIVKMGEGRYYFSLNRHHILFDASCANILIQEVIALYDAYEAGKKLQLDAPSTYRNYIGWLQRQDQEKAESFWRAELKGFTSPTRMAIVREKDRVEDTGHGNARIGVGQDLTARLHKLARAQKITMNTVVQGAWALLLSRYSEELDVVFGTTFLGRPAQVDGIESMVGLFFNTLPLRVKTLEGEAVQDYLKRLQLRLAKIRRYEYSSLLNVQQWSDMPSGTPLFNYLVDVQKASTDADAQGNPNTSLRVAFLGTTGMIDFPLALEVVLGTDLRLGCEYEPGQFDGQDIDRMLRHLETILQAFVKAPEQVTTEVSLLTESERRRLLVEWNDTAVDYPRNRDIHELFEAQVELTPDAIAVCFEGERLTYRELNQRANKLAHYLQRSGVGPEAIVGICAERSLEIIVGVLGSLKAGGAYAPMDPALPRERLSFMLADTRVSALITQQALLEQLPDHHAQMIRLDEDWASIDRESEENPRSQARPENLAYVIYTSGSSGPPKGTLLQRRGLCNLAEDLARTFELRPEDRVLQFFSFSFDASLWNMLLAFTSGASLCIASEEDRLSTPELARLLREEEITVATLSPSVLVALPPERFPALKTIISTAEAISAEIVASWAAGRRFFNGYGPTETTIGVTIGELDDRRIHIGRAWANMQVYILDGRLNPAPIGVPGEICIGGVGLARGYLKRPELTAEKFIPHPFSNEPVARLYKTGDLARYWPEGDIEFLGRIDHQVKVRGFRIELGEIESALQQQAGVQQAAVLLREDRAGEKLLVGYVVAEEGVKLEAAELRRGVGEWLPEYMAPAAVVQLERMPLTPNGKLDRKALPMPDYQNIEGSQQSSPRNVEEEMLQVIFAEVLKLERVGMEQNFFQAGGHSLLATQVMSRVRSAMGVEVPLRALFESPTVAGLAEWLRRARRAGLLAQPPLAPVERRTDLLLSYAQQRLWFLDRFSPGSVAYNMPFGLRLKGELNWEALGWSFNELVKRHEVLRTVFVEGEGGPAQAIAEELNLQIEEIDLRGWQEREREVETERIVREEVATPFDLGRGPLLRVKLLRIGEQEHGLLVTLHHIVFDGWSVEIMVREIAYFYEAYVKGEKPKLPELPVQYADYAMWQRGWLQGEALEQQLGYWKKQLEGVAVLELPANRRPGMLETEAGESVPWSFSEELGRELMGLGRRQSATLFMTLLAGFQVLLSRYSGQKDISVGTPIAGRTRTEVEGLIGFFVNTLVMRTELKGRSSFLEVLGGVREMTLAAYMHQDLPFEKLVEELQPERNLSGTPLFQVMFILQNVPLTELELPELKMSNLSVASQTEKFELTLVAMEQGGRIQGQLSYRKDLFEESSIRRLLGHWENLMTEIVTDAERRVAELPLLTRGERRQLLVEWNRTEDRSVVGQRVHELFLEQVMRTPDAVAVEAEGQVLSYVELNRRANQVGHYLKRQGVWEEVIVGLCVERCLEMMVGLLGILKAGGAYLPLDPDHPPQRLKYMLEDAQAPLLLTHSALEGRLPHGQSRVVYLDRDWGQIAEQSGDDLGWSVGGENLAYVIYTSGSTGNPKGVMIEHRSLVNILGSVCGRVGVSKDDSLLATTTISFDIAALELFMPLLVGGRVVVTAGVKAGLHKVVQRAQEGDITLLQATPTLWNELVGELDGGMAKRLKILCGGEALESATARRLVEAGKRVWNMYGPTETTVWSAIYEVEDVGDSVLAIGKPLANTQVYIVDEEMEPVPVELAGELYIGGTGLARGYWRRPELTAERFLPDPFGERRGERLYWTGDRASYGGDGNLKFLGRVDHQVKVRGYRIELGEIEAKLCEHPGVEQAIVVAREDQPGEKRLVGYVVRKAGQKPQAQVSQIVHWQNVWQQLYEPAEGTGATSSGDFNLAGWNSSYSGEPIPAEEMLIWVEETVAQLRALSPASILEIGCGTGLLLNRLAMGCESYIGLDFSEVALLQLGQHLVQRGNLNHVELRQGMAHDLSFATENSVDLVILNSVAQYFPDMDYLLRVLAEAVRVTRPGGHIFVGDVRSFPLLEAYHASVQIYRGADDMSLIDLRRRIKNAVTNEEELTVDPALFDEIGRRWEKIGCVKTFLKAGAYDNELSRFRYDVTLSLGKKEVVVEPEQWLAWDEAGQWRIDLEESLVRQPGVAMGVRGLQHSRTAGIAEALRILNTDDSSVSNVGQLRTVCARVGGEHPDRVMEFAGRLGVEYCWQANGNAGVYDLVFNPRWERMHADNTAAVGTDVENSAEKNQEEAYRYFRRFGNEPAQSDDADLGQVLREHVRQSLPDYMAPSAILVLPEWPLTLNGKVDRRALPAPEIRNTQGYRAPRAPQEEMLCEIFAEILKQERVGVDDNFFDFGGHSLLATRLISRVSSVFQVELPLRAVFETPTVAGLARRIEHEKRGGAGITVPPIKRVSRHLPLPLSYAQQRLWFLDQLEPGSVAYNMPFGLRINGELSLDGFRWSLNELVRRHEALRTNFVMQDENPAQIVAEELTLKVEEVDLRAKSEAERESELQRLAREEAAMPFNLGHGPLLRAKLLRMGEQEHGLLANMHHIVSDAWSVEIILREITQLYEAKVKGEELHLAELPVQYGDYAVWQRAWLQGEVLERQVAYWKQQLAGVPVLELPTDCPNRNRGALENQAGELVSWVLSDELGNGLRAIGRREGATLFMTLLAAFQALLSRYTGQNDISVGTPIAGRTRPELEGMIGCFMNTLVLRTQLIGRPGFVEVLRRARETALGAYANQDVPFEKLVEEMQVERHLGITPLFQVMFMLQNVPRSESKLGGLTFSSLKISPEVERFEFTLTAMDEGGRICCELNYRRALFAEGTIRRLLRHWENLLTEIVRDPQIPVGELPILSKAERLQLLIEWNRTRAEYSIKCVHELFEQQASRMPESVALVFDGQEMTYGELNRRAGRLAGYLKTLGAGPEVLVGICIERSLEMLVGLLGILKSGAAYLPLDPAYPVERLRYLAEDSRIRIAVTQQHLLDVIPEIIITRVCLDSPWEGEGQPLENGVNTSGGVDNLAYVIYTSGSTGRPKGVGVSHRNVANFFKGMDDAVHCCTEDILLAVTNITFDISIVELFWALTRGVKVALAPDPLAVHSRPRENSEAKEATYGGKLPGELADVYRPTIMQCTPSTMNSLLAGNEGFASFSSLGTLMLGGERLPASLARLIKESLPCKLLNMYGPTETTIWSSTSEVSEAESVISIGKPIVNTEFYVLDDFHLQPVPIGITGELCIGGHGVARGYIDRADLTAEKFITDPFADRPGSRLYRTGDLARYLPDGKVELLGRKDNQVKIRGHRIELGEIEAVLGQCPGVQACVVTVHEDDSTEKRIVAYVVQNGFGVAQSGELKDYLREWLPGYMAPAAIVELEKLPLTQNGKVNLRALPKPQKTGMEIDLLPWNDVELQLAFVWEELLELSNIGRKQAFFDLGGHSLLAIRLVRRIKEKFGKDLPVSAIFEHPTIEELAKRLRQDYQPVRRRNLVAIYRGGSKPTLFFVHPAGGDAQCYRHLARALGDDQPFYAFQPLDEEEIKKDAVISVEERAAQYVAELREFQRSGPYLIGGWSFGAYIAFEIAQQLWRQNQVVERLFLLDITTRPAPQIMQQQQQQRFQDEADELLYMAMVDVPQVASSFQSIEGQGPEERLSNVVHQLVKAGIVPAEIEMSQVRTWMEARKRRIQSLLSYNFLPYPGTVTLLRSTEGIVPLEGTDIAPDDPTLGFAKVSPEVQVHYVSGTTHNNMVRQPHEEKVAALMKKCLPDVKSLRPPAA